MNIENVTSASVDQGAQPKEGGRPEDLRSQTNLYEVAPSVPNDTQALFPQMGTKTCGGFKSRISEIHPVRLARLGASLVPSTSAFRWGPSKVQSSTVEVSCAVAKSQVGDVSCSRLENLQGSKPMESNGKEISQPLSCLFPPKVFIKGLSNSWKADQIPDRPKHALGPCLIFDLTPDKKQNLAMCPRPGNLSIPIFF